MFVPESCHDVHLLCESHHRTQWIRSSPHVAYQPFTHCGEQWCWHTHNSSFRAPCNCAFVPKEGNNFLIRAAMLSVEKALIVNRVGTAQCRHGGHACLTTLNEETNHQPTQASHNTTRNWKVEASFVVARACAGLKALRCVRKTKNFALEIERCVSISDATGSCSYVNINLVAAGSSWTLSGSQVLNRGHRECCFICQWKMDQNEALRSGRLKTTETWKTIVQHYPLHIKRLPRGEKESKNCLHGIEKKNPQNQMKWISWSKAKVSYFCRSFASVWWPNYKGRKSVSATPNANFESAENHVWKQKALFQSPLPNRTVARKWIRRTNGIRSNSAKETFHLWRVYPTEALLH